MLHRKISSLIVVFMDCLRHFDLTELAWVHNENMFPHHCQRVSISVSITEHSAIHYVPLPLSESQHISIYYRTFRYSLCSLTTVRESAYQYSLQNISLYLVSVVWLFLYFFLNLCHNSSCFFFIGFSFTLSAFVPHVTTGMALMDTQALKM